MLVGQIATVCINHVTWQMGTMGTNTSDQFEASFDFQIKMFVANL